MKTDDKVIKKLNDIYNVIAEQNLLKKEVLDSKETCRYLKMSYSTLSSLTAKSNIPYYKPNKRHLYFKRSELDQWMLQNKNDEKSALENKAFEYIAAHKTKNFLG